MVPGAPLAGHQGYRTSWCPWCRHLHMPSPLPATLRLGACLPSAGGTSTPYAASTPGRCRPLPVLGLSHDRVWHAGDRKCNSLERFLLAF
jgi:hypothetical protein